MKIGSFSLPLVICSLSLLAPSLKAQMPSPAEMVRVDVRIESESDRKDLKGSSADRVTQSKTLEINLSGKPKTPEKRVVKWAVFGRGMKNNDISVLERGQFDLDLSDRGMQKMQSKKVTTTSTPEHVVTKRIGGNANNRNARLRGKKVAGSGAKYVGYAVQVREGNKILGEAYDPPGMKAEMK